MMSEEQFNLLVENTMDIFASDNSEMKSLVSECGFTDNQLYLISLMVATGIHGYEMLNEAEGNRHKGRKK